MLPEVEEEEEEEGGFVRPRRATRAAAAAAARAQEAAEEAAPAATAPPPPPPRRRPARRPAAAAAPVHPLPPVLAALEPVFATLAAAHDFLARQHIIPTWRLVVSSSSAAADGGGPAAAALPPRLVRALAALIPAEIRLRPPAWREAAARYKAAAAAEAAAAAAEAAGGQADPARPWAASTSTSPPGPAPAAAAPAAAPIPGLLLEAPIPDDWVLDMARPRTRAGGSAGGRARAVALRGALAGVAAALEAEVGGEAAADGPWPRSAAAPLVAFVRAAARAKAAARPPPPPPSPPTALLPHPRPPGPAALLAALTAEPWYRGQVAAIVTLPARPGVHAAPTHPLSPPALAAAAAAGILHPARLYSHQAAALDAAASASLTGRPVLVTTPTASGKSLCFTLPLAAALAADPGATALLLFPTKALAQDQCRAVNRALAAAGVVSDTGAPVAAVFDGDVPRADRAGLLAHARCLLTNPDMLHVTLLPGLKMGGGGGDGGDGGGPLPVPPGGGWPAFLARLALVAVDEVHAYTGAFGSHTALVLRRLWRAVDACRGSGGGKPGAAPHPPSPSSSRRPPRSATRASTRPACWGGGR